MNGPQHYREAERLAAAYKDAITTAEALPSDTPRAAEDRFFAAGNARSLLDKAQVHATLALAAATMTVGLGMSGETVTEWSRLVAVPGPTCSVKGCGLNRSMESDHCLGHTRELGDVAS